MTCPRPHISSGRPHGRQRTGFWHSAGFCKTHHQFSGQLYRVQSMDLIALDTFLSFMSDCSTTPMSLVGSWFWLMLYGRIAFSGTVHSSQDFFLVAYGLPGECPEGQLHSLPPLVHRCFPVEALGSLYAMASEAPSLTSACWGWTLCYHALMPGMPTWHMANIHPSNSDVFLHTLWAYTPMSCWTVQPCHHFVVLYWWCGFCLCPVVCRPVGKDLFQSWFPSLCEAALGLQICKRIAPLAL